MPIIKGKIYKRGGILKARDIMTTDVVSVSEGSSIVEAAQKMKRADVGSLPVEENDRIVGIVTDRDIVLRNVADEHDPNRETCGEIMSTDVVAVDPEMSVEEVSRLMSSHQIKRIPVVENDRVVGMISLKDISQTRDLQDEAAETLNDITESDSDNKTTF